MMDTNNVCEMFRLDGMVGIVTGGARNLGFDMALALAEAGADVAITSRSRTRAEESAKKIYDATGRQVLPLEVDVRNEAECEAMVDATLAEFGKIDILVNNVGNVTSTVENAPFEKRSSEMWRDTMAVNLDSVFFCSKHTVAKAMKPARAGVIINIASTTGVIGKDRRVCEGTDMGGATLDYHASIPRWHCEGPPLYR